MAVRKFCLLYTSVVDKQEFMEENDRIWGKKVVVDAGDSQNLQPGQIVTARKLSLIHILRLIFVMVVQVNALTNLQQWV